MQLTPYRAPASTALRCKVERQRAVECAQLSTARLARALERRDRIDAGEHQRSAADQALIGPRHAERVVHEVGRDAEGKPDGEIGGAEKAGGDLPAGSTFGMARELEHQRERRRQHHRGHHHQPARGERSRRSEAHRHVAHRPRLVDHHRSRRLRRRREPSRRRARAVRSRAATPPSRHHRPPATPCRRGRKRAAAPASAVRSRTAARRCDISRDTRRGAEPRSRASSSASSRPFGTRSM